MIIYLQRLKEFSTQDGGFAGSWNDTGISISIYSVVPTGNYSVCWHKRNKSRLRLLLQFVNYNNKLQKFPKKQTKIVQTRNLYYIQVSLQCLLLYSQNSSYYYYNLSRHNCRKRTTNLSRTILLRDVCLPRRQQKE